MGLVERWGIFAHLSPRAEAAIARLNSLMMTVYLWHVPCLLIGGIGLLLIAHAVPSVAPFLLMQGTVVVVGVLVMSLVVPAVGWVEYKLIPPLGERQDRSVALFAFCLTIVGTMGVWQFGTVLDPRSPGSTLGVIAIWLGSWLMVRASRPVGVAKAEGDTLKP